jgi:hypothetical protein
MTDSIKTIGTSQHRLADFPLLVPAFPRQLGESVSKNNVMPISAAAW